ncbi:hypothetical protein J4441_03890 [Candidatus Micrarchaeota archaeon]|nr:hypothetical protein [Candidatus Micrarchaeota archaeon]
MSRQGTVLVATNGAISGPRVYSEHLTTPQDYRRFRRSQMPFDYTPMDDAFMRTPKAQRPSHPDLSIVNITKTLPNRTLLEYNRIVLPIVVK